ncbi:hypothetical protein PMIN06_007369 [Paraphaeosphaeria minitans]|uniref:F-box domain-containing protein n=1 Tax=Paraphaeosphaeria minitans TaxID=565426 RepID=A0A9P6GNT8_9PLEO|nr:hypothetical protein PMIN01_03761 [Paraphaeosphaeria minitans]
MANIAPKPSGFRSKFGFGRNKDAAPHGKLRKKNAAQAEFDVNSIHSRDTARSDGKLLLYPQDVRRSGSVTTTLSKLSTDFTPWRNSSEGRSQSVISKNGPRKLKKASHQAPARSELDKDTGEHKDLTDMMHAFGFSENADDTVEYVHVEEWSYDTLQPDGATLLSKICPELWGLIGDYLTPLDIAHLASTCHAMHNRLGKVAYELLRHPTHLPHRIEFLLSMDKKLPTHLFCFPCAKWHVRTTPGLEKLKPPNILNPVYNCPNSTNVLMPPPRLRISDYRWLPFTFIQLYKRAWEHGPDYGINVHSLARRFKDVESGWSHETMFHIHPANGHVLMRVKSQVFVEGGLQPAAKRMLLFTRSDYTPYFSVCAHWRKGLLTSIPKCALDHIPTPEENVYRATFNKMRHTKFAGPTALCTNCQPMRRCVECPTEYLIELKLVEDKTVQKMGPERFRQVLLVTRWSDLGPARSPRDPEWASVIGEGDGYNSFQEIGKRAVSGIFESAFTDTTPRARILSLNPAGLEADEDHGDWY